MKRSEVRQPGQRRREPRMLAIMVSMMLHGVVVVGVMVTTWWWGRSAFEPGSAYTVSLVDAPLSLQQPTSAPPPLPPLTPPEDQDKAPVAAAKPPPPEQPPEQPKKQLEEQKTAKPEPPAKSGPPPKSETVTPKPKPSPPVEPAAATSKEARSAIARLRQQQAQQDARRQQVDVAQKQAAAERVEALREQVAQETSPGAKAETMAGLQRVRFAAYQERVRTKIMKAWVLPLPPEQSRTLQATVLFRVARDGHIDRLDMVQSSGNTLFDASLLRAIKRASPLPELPADYAKDVLEVEMRFSTREPAAG